MNTVVRIGNRYLTAGDLVGIKGERGQFKFIDAHTTSEGHIVLNFVGGPHGHYSFRSFYPDRVKFPPKKRQRKAK